MSTTITLPKIARLALGTAIDNALGKRSGIKRFGYAYAPLDESLARTVIDLSGQALA